MHVESNCFPRVSAIGCVPRVHYRENKHGEQMAGCTVLTSATDSPYDVFEERGWQDTPTIAMEGLRL